MRRPLYQNHNHFSRPGASRAQQQEPIFTFRGPWYTSIILNCRSLEENRVSLFNICSLALVFIFFPYRNQRVFIPQV